VDLGRHRQLERGIFHSGECRAVWVKDPDGNTFAITAADGSASGDVAAPQQ
jgi:hypothetical protein